MKTIIVIILATIISIRAFCQPCQKTLSLSTPTGWVAGTTFPGTNPCNSQISTATPLYHLSNSGASWMGNDNCPRFIFNKSFFVCKEGDFTFNISTASDNQSTYALDGGTPFHQITDINSNAFTMLHPATYTTHLLCGRHTITAAINNTGSYGGFLLNGNVSTDNGCLSTDTCECILPDPCCKNKLGFVTPSVTPPYYAGDGFTYAIEDYNVTVPNDIPITEVRVNVESFELISKYEDCLKCYNPPTTLGSVVGLWNIGSGSNTLQNQNIYPSNWLANFESNVNETTWQNPNGVMLTTNDQFKLIYIFPPASEIPCCVDSAKICLRISWTDVNCGRCETRTCSTVPLMNANRQNAQNATSGQGKAMPGPAKSLKEIIESVKSQVQAGSTKLPLKAIESKKNNTTKM